MRVLISRTDAIGDVVLTLPLAERVKAHFPGAAVGFLCQMYTRDVVSASRHVDVVLDWGEISKDGEEAAAAELRGHSFDVIVHVFPRSQIARVAKRARIPMRIGTSHRLFHWLTCTHWVNFSRKGSDLHEAQLNFALLRPLGVHAPPALADLIGMSGLHAVPWWPEGKPWSALKDDPRKKVILHPGSRGSARNWPLDHFVALARGLDPARHILFLTGTDAEGSGFRAAFAQASLPHVVDVSGQMSLAQLMGFMRHVDVLVAASTGPLHLAASLGVHAIGLYPPLRPMHPGRWAPLGDRAEALVGKASCGRPNQCKGAMDRRCECMEALSPALLLEKI